MDQPLSKCEIEQWVEGLGRTDHQRVRTLLDLIKHRVQDKMSDADYAICKEQLRVLEERIAKRKIAMRKQSEMEVTLSDLEKLRKYGWVRNHGRNS